MFLRLLLCLNIFQLCKDRRLSVRQSSLTGQLDSEYPGIILFERPARIQQSGGKSGVGKGDASLGLLQRSDIVMPEDGRDGHHAIALPNQQQVHQQPSLCQLPS